MSTVWGFLATIAVIAVAGLLLAVVWERVQRGLKVRAVGRPREDRDLQMHQAVSRSQINP